jgi:hypothetical protein
MYRYPPIPIYSHNSHIPASYFLHSYTIPKLHKILYHIHCISWALNETTAPFAPMRLDLQLDKQYDYIDTNNWYMITYIVKIKRSFIVPSTLENFWGRAVI